MVALAVKLVFAVLSVLATTGAPTGVSVNAVGAFGATVSMTIAAFVARFPAVPAVIAGKVRTALLSAASLRLAPVAATSDAVSK
jgi:hypothetical protein